MLSRFFLEKKVSDSFLSKSNLKKPKIWIRVWIFSFIVHAFLVFTYLKRKMCFQETKQSIFITYMKSFRSKKCSLADKQLYHFETSINWNFNCLFQIFITCFLIEWVFRIILHLNSKLGICTLIFWMILLFPI